MFIVGELKDAHLAEKIREDLLKEGIQIRVHFDEKTQVYVLIYAGVDENQARIANEHFRVRVGLPKMMEMDKEWVAIKELPRGETTVIIIVICVVIYLLKTFGNMGDALYGALFISNPESAFFEEIKHGQVWRLLTPIFLHLSILHILFNMMWFKDLGYILEYKLGRKFLLFFMVTTGIFSNLAQYLVAGPSFGGMSGVLYAMLGFVWIYHKLEPKFEITLPNRDIGIMLFWLVLCLTGWLGPIANTAHAGGLFAGMIIALLKSDGHQWKNKLKYFAVASLFLVFTLVIEGVKLKGQYFFTLWS